MSPNQKAETLLSIINLIKDQTNNSKIELDILYNIYNLSINFFKIDRNQDNLPSIVTIARAFFDYYAVYHLLFINGCEEERNLRQKLYLCDGYKSSLNTFEVFMEIDKNNVLKNSVETSVSSVENLKKTFPKDYNKFCTAKHLDNFNWKFKSNTKNENYSWKELYELSLDRKIIAKLISEYFSLYVHGLAIQSIKIENENFLVAINGTLDATLLLLNSRLLKKYCS